MRVFGVIALIAMGALVFLGLGALLHIVATHDYPSEASLSFMGLLGGAGLVFFTSGIIFGFLYGRPARQNPFNKGVIERFRSALDFERRQRSRLDKDLYEAKTAMAGIEDELARAHQLLGEKQPVQPDSNRDSEATREYEELSGRTEKLQGDLLKRKERIADLQVELSIAQAEADEVRKENEEIKAKIPSGAPTDSVLQLQGESVAEVLGQIVALEGVQVAVVADDFGLVVEAKGEGLSSESLAAVSSVFAKTGRSIREVLPQVGDLLFLSVQDVPGLAIDSHFFDLFDTRCALVIARDGDKVYENLAVQAAETIVEKLGS